MTDFASDDELMGRVRADEVAAFGALYDRHKTRVLSFLARLIGDRQTAEDLLQETFIRVWRNRTGYQPSGQFTTWLYTIARHLVVDHRRARKRSVETDDSAELTDSAETADTPARSHERFARIEEALAALPPAHREVVLLSRLAGLDANEIAVVVGSTPGAIRVALHRALKRIRSTLNS